MIVRENPPSFDSDEIFAHHDVVAKQTEFAQLMTLSALHQLTPAHKAVEAEPAAILLRSQPVDIPTGDTPENEAECWAKNGVAFMGRSLRSLSSANLTRAVLPFALALEDYIAVREITKSREHFSRQTEKKSIHMWNFLLPGAMINVSWFDRLALRGRSDVEAAQHIAAHFDVHIEPNLTSHELIDVIPGVEAFMSDLVSFGSHDRHMLGLTNHNRPELHKVRIRLA